MEHRKSVQILPPPGPRNFLRHFWWIKHPAWSWWRSHCGKSTYHQGNASNTKQKAGPYRFSTGAKNEEIQYIPPSCGVWKVFFLNDQATIIQPSSGYWYHAENYAINIPSMLIHSGAVLVILYRIKSTIQFWGCLLSGGHAQIIFVLPIIMIFYVRYNLIKLVIRICVCVRKNCQLLSI